MKIRHALTIGATVLLAAQGGQTHQPTAVHDMFPRGQSVGAGSGSQARAEGRSTARAVVGSTPPMAASGHRVPLLPAAANAMGRQGFVRVINHSGVGGDVSIEAFDDEGTAYGPLRLAIGARETVHFNSVDLENGNANKGLSGNTGRGRGDWRLALDSALDVEVLSYIRTADGFLTAMHDAAPADGGRHEVAIFNPGSNRNQVSLLRLVNPSDVDATVSITAIDDDGTSPGEGATVTIPAGASRTYTAAELEAGGSPGSTGSIGDGSGKWRLVVASEQEIVAMSLLSSPTGHLTNLSTAPDNDAAGVHSVALFPSASDPAGRQGFVRVVNRSAEAGEITVTAHDDTDVAYDSLSLAVGAKAARHFNSYDLELGNARKGLTGGTGAGEGDWRLELTSDLDIRVLAYIRTADGFLTAMHDTVPRSAKRHRVAVFNPGSNENQRSLLRLVNPGSGTAEVTIVGIDDAGESPGSGVIASVPGGASTTLTARELEAGSPDFEGALGDGAGKWSLTVTADRALVATSLLSSPTGHLTNLSTAPQRGAGPVESASEAFEALVSPVVQSRCASWQFAGGEAANTRLIFAVDDDIVGNYGAFEYYVATTWDGAARVLGKIGGELEHPGETLVPAGSREFAGFEQFLRLLGEGMAGDLGTTQDGRIVLGLDPGDLTAGNIFDLGGKTLIFTPGADGGYTRDVRTLAWEDELGEQLGDGAIIALPFVFDFAGEPRRAVTVRESGLLTFEDDYADPHDDIGKGNPIDRYAKHFEVSGKAVIAALWKPLASGELRASKQDDRVVVTWSVTEPQYDLYGVAPKTPTRFQAVLHADGRIAFHYGNVDFRDGVVGLFTGEAVVKGDLIARIEHAEDPALPAHLDLTEVAIYDANDGRAAIIEWATRGAIPERADDTLSYRVYWDTDEPFWEDDRGEGPDFYWGVTINTDGARPGGSSQAVLPRQDRNRVAALADSADVGGISASFVAQAIQWEGDRPRWDGTTRWDETSAGLARFPVPGPDTDLSQAGAGAAAPQAEVFHYPSPSDVEDLACRVVERLGDGYDFLVFHTEFRPDRQHPSSPWTRYQANVGVSGIGLDDRGGLPACETSRLKGRWHYPVWAKSYRVMDDSVEETARFDSSFFQFFHELGHIWTAKLSYDAEGRSEPLFDVGGCACHWRYELHAPTAFPGRPGTRSVMGGSHWRENADGTFTRMRNLFRRGEGEGFSWIDLYAMGLADAGEVPDTFLLRNLRGVAGRDETFTGEKEVVTIDQIMAAEGPRVPRAANSQTVFNAGFVYLIEPGKTPDPESLARHKAYRDKMVEYWERFTGARSQITTSLPDANGAGIVGGRRALRTLGEPGGIVE